MNVSIGPLDHPAQAVLLLRGGEVGRHEEDLQLAIGGQRVDELGELLADRVEHTALGGDLEQRSGVDLGDLFH